MSLSFRGRSKEEEKEKEEQEVSGEFLPQKRGMVHINTCNFIHATCSVQYNYLMVQWSKFSLSVSDSD